MPHQQLAVYVNDHLAGSVGALELLDHLAEAQPDSALADFITALRADIVADRQELESLIERLGLVESRPRKAVAWLTEHSMQIKLRFDDSGSGAMHLFESLEAVSLGIEGKRGLWQALAIVAEDLPELRGVDYARLVQRAVEQRNRVEAARLRNAPAALSAAS